MTAPFERQNGSVFVNVTPPAPVKQVANAKSTLNNWQTVASEIASDLSVPEPTTPITIDEIFAQSVPSFIKASCWGRYIEPNDADSIRDNTVFVHHPGENFWTLYNIARGIFRDLGIRLAKKRGQWVAHIPISCLTDKIFSESGLAAVERTLEKTSPSEIYNKIRQRKSQEAHEGILRLKRNRQQQEVSA